MKINKENGMEFVNKDIIVCDPCYIFDSSNDELSTAWSNFVDMMFPDRNGDCVYPYGILQYNGAKLLFTDTQYGDGTYKAYCNGGEEDLCVDAGMICVISTEDVLKINPNFFKVEIKGLYSSFKDVTGTVCVENNGFVGLVKCDTGDDETEECYDEW